MNALGGNVPPATTSTEPMIFGVPPDPESLRLCQERLGSIEYDTLYKIWKEEDIPSVTVRQFIVARLTAPSSDAAPYGPGQAIGRLMYVQEDVAGTKEYSLRRRLADRPELAGEMAAGVLYWLGTDEGQQLIKQTDPRSDYRTVSRHLLPIVSEKTADKLFDHYTTFGNEMLGELVADRGAPTKYVEASLKMLLETARQELGGEIQPTFAYSSATKVLAHVLGVLVNPKKVNAPLCARIVEFFEQHVAVDHKYAYGFDVARIAQHVTDEDVRFAFVWRHAISQAKSEFGQFRIGNEAELQLARWVRAQAHERGCEEAPLQVLDSIIDEYRARRRRLKEQTVAQAALREALRAAR